MSKNKLRFEEIDEATEYNIYSGKLYLGWIQIDYDCETKRWVFCGADNCCLTQNQLQQVLVKVRKLNAFSIKEEQKK